MAALATLRFAVIAAAGGALASACVIDLGGLTGGGHGGGATTGSAGTDAGDAGQAGDAGCGLLDCSCATGPVVVASGAPFADGALGVAVTSDGLFWADATGGVIVYAPADGGAPQTIADAGTPRAIDVAAGTVVWSADQGVFVCGLASCGSTLHQLQGAAAPGSVKDLVFDGQTVVWSDVGSGPGSGKVTSCAALGCSPIALQTGMMAPYGVAIQGDTAFWVDQGDGNQNGSVSRSPKTTQALTQIASSLDLPTVLVADDTYVYWTEWEAGGRVLRCESTGPTCGAPVDVAPAAGGLPHPRRIRLAGGRIYWTNTDDGSIRSCPTPGCGTEVPRVHVSGRSSLEGLAVGTSCLFWAEDGNGGAVMKIAL